MCARLSACSFADCYFDVSCWFLNFAGAATVALEGSSIGQTKLRECKPHFTITWQGLYLTLQHMAAHINQVVGAFSAMEMMVWHSVLYRSDPSSGLTGQSHTSAAPRTGNPFQTEGTGRSLHRFCSHIILKLFMILEMLHQWFCSRLTSP